MRRFAGRTLMIGVVCSGITVVLVSWPISATSEDHPAIQADRAFVQDVAKADTTAVGRFLDADFIWTDANGKPLTRSQALADLPKPSIADETGARITDRDYGQVELIEAHSGKANILRIWVERPAGWRLLVYQEATLLTGTPTPVAGSAEACVNPCKTLPYKAKNQTERDVLNGYMALQTATVYHNSAEWGKYVADEFSAASSNSSKVLDKPTRMADLERSKMAGYAPMPVVSLRMFDFPDAAVLVTQHQPVHGKPFHITRLWIKRDGHWQETVSYQTRMQSAPAKP
ncbi:MAG TPA: nuclear transport factor 2 family protein [Candidatus Acidoferrales bacterium]|nr:nuclear transport factor 2 family protein [Candidatus Acidoferrales bacterium]